MNTRFLAVLGASGVAIGLLSTFGILPERMELAGWLLAGMLWVVLANRWLESDVFRHLTLGSAIAGFLAADTKVLLWSTYVSTHPSVQQFLAQEGQTAAPRTSIVVSGIFSGIVYGMLIGAPLAWWRLRKQAPEAAFDVAEDE